MSLLGGGGIIRYAVIPTTGPYVGPGDVVAGAAAWWGLRAYTSTSIGTNAVRLREDGGNTEQDFATIAGGGLDLSAISAFKGANNLFISKLYDQTGNGIDILEATAGVQPAFILAALGSLPVARFSGDHLDSPAFTQAQPLTISAVANRTTGTGQQDIIIDITTGAGLYFFPSANLAFGNAGGNLPAGGATAADGSFHDFQCVFNAASSNLYVDGSGNTGNAGTNGFSTNIRVGFLLGGDFTEGGIWGTTFAGTDATNMSANQHAYWGF